CSQVFRARDRRQHQGGNEWLGNRAPGQANRSCISYCLHDGCCRRRLGIGRRAQQHSTEKAVCSSAIGYSGVPAPQRGLAELTVCEKGYSINYLSSRWATSAISNGNPNSQSRSKMTCEIVSQSHDMGFYRRPAARALAISLRKPNLW